MDAAARTLAKRYARAYMDLGGKTHDAALDKAALDKLNGLRRLFEAARPHFKVLTHPVVNSGVKLEVLEKILGAANTGPAAAFAALLVKQGRFGLFEEIMRECLSIYYDFSGVTRADVYSRYPLSEGEFKRMEKMLVCMTGRKISLRQVIAERVLGGFEIRVGDTLIDATMRGRLEAMKAGLLI